MGMVHQKGKLNTPFEEKTRRSATPSSGRSSKLGLKDTLAQQIQSLVQLHGLTVSQAAARAGETPTRMSLILGGKMFGVSIEQLTVIRNALTSSAEEAKAP